MAMTTVGACEAIQQTRPDAIFVTTMGAMNGMDKLETSSLSVACVPLMGGAASLGLGLAIASPAKNVIVLDGDASLLMELGGLVSVAQAAPTNFVHVVFNNSIQFSGLGNLDTPGSCVVDLPAMAKAAGYRSAWRFGNLDDLKRRIAEILAAPGPVFVELVVAAEDPKLGTDYPAIEMTDARFTRMGDELRRIRAAVAHAT